MRGLERGIERAIGSIRTAAFVEIEAFVCENLVRQMEQGLLAPTPVWSNLKTFPAKEFHGKIHGIIGGYPCQPFSVGGKQIGEQDPRHLWPFIKQQVAVIRPVWCFFENVPGHINLGYENVRRDLQELGYHVEEGIFSAEEVGAPHQRKRLFILALDNTYRASAKNEVQAGGHSFGLSSEELGYTKGLYVQGQHNGQGEVQPWGASNELADTDSERLQGWGCGELSECGSERSFRQGDSQTQWPARPGQDQYEWENPRTIWKGSKSGMGTTINGYNFREDLLRMAGNGVVEQTAELAFLSLWKKSVDFNLK
jgi:DNA (cytosine-5)-methyltransferase 1